MEDQKQEQVFPILKLPDVLLNHCLSFCSWNSHWFILPFVCSTFKTSLQSAHAWPDRMTKENIWHMESHLLTLAIFGVDRLQRYPMLTMRFIPWDPILLRVILSFFLVF